MKISYNKLFALMDSKGLKKYDLRKGVLHPSTVARLIKNEAVSTDTIVKLCEYLQCQPGDIMECV